MCLCACGHSACGRPSSFHSLFADDTHLIGLIVSDDWSDNADWTGKLTDYCIKNYLELNVNKTEEIAVDFYENKQWACVVAHHYKYLEGVFNQKKYIE